MKNLKEQLDNKDLNSLTKEGFESINNKKRYDILSTFDGKRIEKELGEFYANLGEIHTAQVEAFKKLSVSEKAADLKSTEACLRKIGRPPISGGDLTERKTVTLRASTWARIETERQERESVSACLDRIVDEALKKEEKKV